MCLQQADGCVWCVGRDGEAPYLEAEASRPWVCDPKDSENCVEFCSALVPGCALPWVKGPGCVYDSEAAFGRALFARDATGRRPAAFAGRVVDEAGKRIEGARIRLWVVSRRNQPTELEGAVSGREGAFRLGLPTGPWSYALHVSYPGLAGEVVEKIVADKLDRSVPGLPRVFRLVPEHPVRGRVVDAATGAPIEEARVLAARSVGDAIEAGATSTAADGGFVLGGLGQRRYFLRVSKFGWRLGTTKGPVTAPAGRVTVKLTRANVIRGVVRDTAGEPEPNATVIAVLSGVPGAPAVQYPLTTDAEGRFRQDHFSAGTYYLWARRGDMFVYPPEKIDLGQSQDVEVTLVLTHKGARVSGRVLARPGLGLGKDGRAVLVGRSPLAFPRTAAAELGEGGRFLIAGALPGRYELHVRDGGRILGIVAGPREVEVPIEPNSAVALKEPVVVRAQTME